MSCSNCKRQVHCCVFEKSGFCFVGIKNAKQIQKKIKKPYSSFLDYSPLPKKIIKELHHCDPALEGALRCKQLNTCRILRLKKQENGDCIFLRNGKCAVYSVRPNICKIFPYWVMKLTSGKLKVIAHDPDSACSLLKDPEKLSLKETARIKKIYKEILKENNEYRKRLNQKLYQKSKTI